MHIGIHMEHSKNDGSDAAFDRENKRDERILEQCRNGEKNENSFGRG